MAEVIPFRGVRYKAEKVGDISFVICPPYDVIDKGQESELYSKSPYNYIRIEYPHGAVEDTEQENKYSRAAASLKKWMKEGILAAEDKQAIYIHDHHFVYDGRRYRKRGIIAAVGLEEWQSGVILPHEDTLSAPKEDRINMLWWLETNTSPIYSIYEDKSGEIATLLQNSEDLKPIVTAADVDSGQHEVKVVKDEAILAELTALFQEKKLYIADGHHRYTSALNYRSDKKKCQAGIGSNHPANFVMMELVAFEDTGLLVLPPHRLLSDVSTLKLEKLTEGLGEYFKIEELSFKDANALGDLEDRLKKGPTTRLITYGLDKEKLQLIEANEKAMAMMPLGHSAEYNKLNVSILEHVIMERIMGYTSGQSARVDFHYQACETITKIRKGEYQLAFIVGAADTGVIKKIADVGDRMPRKSTYFYPKTPSGLVLRSLNH